MLSYITLNSIQPSSTGGFSELGDRILRPETLSRLGWVLSQQRALYSCSHTVWDRDILVGWRSRPTKMS